MKNYRTALKPYSLILLLFLSSFIIARELPTSVRLSTHELHPYGQSQPGGSFKGKAADVVVCSFKNMGVELELNIRPWKRAQYEALKGVSDGFFAGSQNDERDAYAQKSTIIADQKWVWYLLKDSSWDPNSDYFQKNAIVSSFLGANMQDWLVSKNYKIDSTPLTTEHLIGRLLRRSIDAGLANNYVMNEILEKIGAQNKVRKVLLKNKPLYVYFGNNFIDANQGFLSLFNQHAKTCIEKMGQPVGLE